MKKVFISVGVTLLVLLLFAQMGFLEYFGIHGLHFTTEKDSGKDTDADKSSGFSSYTDVETGVSSRFKVDGDYFYVYEDGDWKELFMAGVNIGATEPALFPGDLSISYETYYRWFQYISDMNCNCIRVYTTMRPQFYMALDDFNKQSDNPLYLYQGIWMNEEDIERLSDVYAENEKILNEFISDSIQLVDVIHGNATILESPGKASGTYTTDVSSWLVGWIVGIEWEPNFVLNTNKQHPDKREFDGEYLYTQTATAFEAFLCRAGDAIIKHETEKYKYQTTLAFSNWITTDPLIHPNEPHADEDKAVVNTENIKSRNFTPGMFASYHIYPYYPDSLNYQEDYLQYIDENGNVNTYLAYLEDLKLSHTMPIIVAEFGLPTSRGKGHESVMGYDQGRIDENVQGKMVIDMFNSIKEADYAGGIVFTWQDEWFKRTWNNVMFDIPDQRPFWSNIQTTEQCFGILTFDPGKKDCICYVDGDSSDWKGVEPLVKTEQGKLCVMSDERYVYIMVEAKDFDFNTDTMFIPINTKDNQGNTASNEFGLTFDKEADFLIVLNGANDSHIYVDNYYDAFYYHFIDSKMLTDYSPVSGMDVKNSGNFGAMNMCYGYNMTVKGTGEIIPDKIYETGKLQYGNANPESEDYASLADICAGAGFVEIKIPWQLLNVMDPSTKQQMDDFWETQVISATDYEGFDFGFAFRSNDNENLKISLSGNYEHSEWKIPTWHERLKPAYYELQEYLKQFREEK